MYVSVCIFLFSDEFKEMKAKGDLPFGQLPLATFYASSGEEIVSIAQSRAILHALGKMSIGSANAIGSDDFKTSAKIDEMMDFEEDLFAALRMSTYSHRYGIEPKEKEETLAWREKIMEVALKPKLAVLEAKLDERLGGDCLAG